VSSLFAGIEKLDPKRAFASYKEIRSLLKQKNDSGNFSNWPALDPGKRDGFLNFIDNKEVEMKNRIEAQRKQAQVDAKQDFDLNMKIYENLLSSGNPPDAQTSASIYEQAKAIGPKAILALKSTEQKYGAAWMMEKKAEDPSFGTPMQAFTQADFSDSAAFQKKLAFQFSDREKDRNFQVMKTADAAALAKLIESNPAMGMFYHSESQKKLWSCR